MPPLTMRSFAPEAELKDCVADELGVDPSSAITEADMTSLTTLACSAPDEMSRITDLTPLVFATILTTLWLYDNAIVDPVVTDIDGSPLPLTIVEGTGSISGNTVT
ncbi:MAG: hypothetical protein ACK5KU_00145, partial [Beutenbergiaceae bacterium]